MSVLIVIPARMASSRLPDKPLADLEGVPMVVRVAQAAMAAGFGVPVIAAAEEEIVLAAKAYGISAVLTDPALPSGSDRVLAAANSMDPQGEADIVVNVQGDMPQLLPEHVSAVIEALQANPQADIATLAFASMNTREREDENVVKVLFANSSPAQIAPACDFTRTLPLIDAATPTRFWHHIGIYAYRRAVLQRFCVLPPSAREKSERLEQLRALDAGMYIVCAMVAQDCPGIDSPEDLARLRAQMKEEKNSD